MAVTTTTSSVSYEGDGSETEFSVPFPFLDEEHLEVVTITPGDVETELTLTTDYTVTGTASGTGYSSGVVTLGTAATDGHTVRIRRQVPLTQPVALRTQGAYLPGTLETMADRLLMQVQQIADAAIAANEIANGETNTASNVNSVGVGVFEEKDGFNLEFRGVVAGSAKITIAYSAITKAISVDLGTVSNSDITYPIAGSLSTTNATETTLASYTTTTDKLHVIEVDVVAYDHSGAQGAGYKLAGLFRNNGGTLSQLGMTTSIMSTESPAGLACAFDMSGTAVRVRVTGIAATTFTWDCTGRVLVSA